MIERKKVNGHNRTLLLKLFMDRKISKPVQESIIEPFRDCPEEKKEQLAKDILDRIQDCKTEDEMLQNLKRSVFLNRKCGNGHYRALLFRRVMQMNLSETTQKLITSRFKDCGKDTERLEKAAHEILCLIEDCENEDDVLQKIRRPL